MAWYYWLFIAMAVSCCLAAMAEAYIRGIKAYKATHPREHARLLPCPFCGSMPIVMDDNQEGEHPRYELSCACLFTGDDAALSVSGCSQATAEHRWNVVARSVAAFN